MALFSMSICPGMDGLQLLEQLQKDRIRATVIMVSTTTTKDADVTIRAMERGAVDFVTKPTNVIEAKGEEFKKQLLGVLSAVCATQSYNRERRITPQTKAVSVPAGTAKPVATAGHAIKSGSKIVALACSTGGPKALQSVIPYLPKNLDAPMVLVQHMPAGFTKSMADRLDEVSPIHVKEAEDGDVLMKGTVYIAPGGKHMEVKRQPDGSHRIRLNDMPAIGGLKPCQHHVRFPAGLRLRSGCMRGSHRNGCGRHQGIVSLAGKKPVYVIAQDAASCVVYGMPKAVAEAGVVDEVVPLNDVAKSIIKNVGVK